ncbi:MAG: hypothetical protein IH977_03715 [Nitrospinae bacterium]|nr:hypothetical protein [Nitrospinota bacterium]
MLDQLTALDWVLLVLLFINGLVSILWGVHYSRAKTETISAKEAVISAKNAQIEALDREIESLKYLTPMKLQEYLGSTKEAYEEWVANLQEKLDLANETIKGLETKIGDISVKGEESKEEITKLKTEKGQLMESKGDLEDKLKDLKGKISHPQDIESIEASVASVTASSTKLQDTLVETGFTITGGYQIFISYRTEELEKLYKKEYRLREKLEIWLKEVDRKFKNLKSIQSKGEDSKSQ